MSELIIKDFREVAADYRVIFFDSYGVLRNHRGMIPGARETIESLRRAGKTIRVLVFAKGEKALEAQEAGADHVGGDDLVEKIKGGWFEFDTAIATPDTMGTVGKIGKLLGPRGLMPNPKVGTVTFEVARAVNEAKSGKVEYRVEKAGIVHAPVGKVSFDAEKLKGNLLTLMDALFKAKPSTAKGTYVKKVTISATMGPGVNVDIPELQALSK